MGKTYMTRKTMLTAAVLLALVGCGSEDTERLAKVARYLGAKVETLAGGANEQLPNWPGLRPQLENLTLETRVSGRVAWEKSLDGLHIEVSVDGNIVTLKGTVNDLDQRRRAVDLARTTVGVEDVVDELEVTP